jgi:hypothetical protein
MLSNPMRDYLTTKNKDVKYSKKVQGVYNVRLKKQALEAIADLTLIAEGLNERQLEKVFNNGTMKPFFEALYKIDFKAENSEQWLKIKQHKKTKSKRNRLFGLAKTNLYIIGNGQFVSTILPESSRHHLSLLTSTAKNIEELFETLGLE